MRFTPVVKNLLILNIAFYVVVFLDQQLGLSAYGNPGGYLGLSEMLSLHYPESPQFLPVQLVTHFFMHGSLMHIFFNMFALSMFGPPLESMWGPKKFLFFYFACAFGSAALHMGYTWWEMSQLQDMIAAYTANPSIEIFDKYFAGTPLENYRMDDGSSVSSVLNEIRSSISGGDLKVASDEGSSIMREWYELKRDIPMVGASGAVYGLLLAFGMYFPDYKLMLIFLPVPIKARYFIPVLILVEIFLGFQKYSWDNIAHFAHLGGALIGFLLIIYWRKTGNSSGQRWD